MSSSQNPLVENADSLSSFRANGAIVAFPTIRIAHISDLHFVEHPLLRRMEWYGGIRGHDRETLKALENTLAELRPNILFVTGDQTTWGDKSSLRASRKFVEDLTNGIQLSQECVVWIPGNHDVLLNYYFGHPWFERNYNAVFGKAECCRFLHIGGYEVGVFSFDSTLDWRLLRSPLWPLVGSRGKVTRKSFNEYNAAASTPDAKRCHFKIALVHHHPLPIPYKDNGEIGLELTTMSNGGTFIAYMQESHIDLVLHGHEHFPYSCLYSFNPDSPNVIIAAAGTACQRGTQQNSFNYLEVVPQNRIVIRQYGYDETGFRRRSVKIFALDQQRNASHFAS